MVLAPAARASVELPRLDTMQKLLGMCLSTLNCTLDNLHSYTPAWAPEGCILRDMSHTTPAALNSTEAGSQSKFLVCLYSVDVA